jgi:hypothetical protein
MKSCGYPVFNIWPCLFTQHVHVTFLELKYGHHITINWAMTGQQHKRDLVSMHQMLMSSVSQRWQEHVPLSGYPLEMELRGSGCQVCSVNSKVPHDKDNQPSI